MFSLLKDLFTQIAGPSEEEQAQQTAHQLQLSTAVLLVEVMRADPTLEETERLAVLRALKARFQLSETELVGLMTLAQDTAKSAYDYQHFTGLMNEHLTQPQKIGIIESMWTVAYADAHLDAHENHVISKVAGLLHVTHGEYIGAKMRAKEVAGIA
ncbi:MAG TPA: TerB family tellurite resistance protein [Hydrogenophaga sp.]